MQEDIPTAASKAELFLFVTQLPNWTDMLLLTCTTIHWNSDNAAWQDIADDNVENEVSPAIIDTGCQAVVPHSPSLLKSQHLNMLTKSMPSAVAQTAATLSSHCYSRHNELWRDLLCCISYFHPWQVVWATAGVRRGMWESGRSLHKRNIVLQSNSQIFDLRCVLGSPTRYR